MSAPRSHVPPLGLHALTGLYDAVVAGTMPEREFRSRIVARASPQAGEHVLDLGCGTGELTLALLDHAPEARVTALDPDRTALDIATRKFRERARAVRRVQGASDHPDLTPGSFDLVASSLVLHHLSTPAKARVLIDIVRLLRPGGRVAIGDWAGARSLGDRLRFLPIRILDGFANTRANTQGALPGLLVAAGFTEIVEADFLQTMFGPLSILTAKRTEG